MYVTDVRDDGSGRNVSAARGSDIMQIKVVCNSFKGADSSGRYVTTAGDRTDKQLEEVSHCCKRHCYDKLQGKSY